MSHHKGNCCLSFGSDPEDGGQCCEDDEDEQIIDLNRRIDADTELLEACRAALIDLREWVEQDLIARLNKRLDCTCEAPAYRPCGPKCRFPYTDQLFDERLTTARRRNHGHP